MSDKGMGKPKTILQCKKELLHTNFGFETTISNLLTKNIACNFFCNIRLIYLSLKIAMMIKK